MQMDVGKYRGREMSELPSEYLEWALGHLALSDEAARAVLCEHSRRRNQARAAGKTPIARAADHAARPANRLVARLRTRLLSWLRKG